MTFTVILAANPTEASAYARENGLHRGAFRFAAQAASIRGLRVADVVELPSFQRRPDRHAINAALRFVRGERTVVSGKTAEKKPREDPAPAEVEAPAPPKAPRRKVASRVTIRPDGQVEA